MAEVKADVKIGDQLGLKVADGLYAMQNGLVYTDNDGKVEEASETVEIPNSALDAAEDAKYALELRAKSESKDA